MAGPASAVLREEAGYSCRVLSENWDPWGFCLFGLVFKFKYLILIFD